MDAVNIFSVGLNEKNCSFFHYKLLNGMIFTERERERERSSHRYIIYRALVCAYIRNHSHNIVFAMLWLFCFRFVLLPQKLI